MNTILHSRSTAFALAAAAIFVAPVIAFAQTGYGGGTGGGGGSNNAVLTIVPINGAVLGVTSNGSIGPVGQVLGASAYYFGVTLMLGSEGEDVTELQKILIAGGYLDIDAPTGFFGPLTEAAVKAFQKANGLESVGIVGPLTRALLNKGTTPSSDTQKKILELQTLIDSLIAQMNALRAGQTN